MEILEAQAWRRRQAEKATITTAWHTAVFIGLAKAGKLEGLEQYIGEEESAPEPVELTPKQSELLMHVITLRPQVH